MLSRTRLFPRIQDHNDRLGDGGCVCRVHSFFSLSLIYIPPRRLFFSFLASELRLLCKTGCDHDTPSFFHSSFSFNIQSFFFLLFFIILPLSLVILCCAAPPSLSLFGTQRIYETPNEMRERVLKKKRRCVVLPTRGKSSINLARVACVFRIIHCI